MALQSTADSALLQFLKTAPAEYRQQDPNSSLEVVVSVDEQSTTCKWAQQVLHGVKLRKTQWKWRDERIYEHFTSFVNKQDPAKVPVPVVQQIPFEYPRSEADVGIAIEAQVLLPIWSISQGWIPNPVSCPSTQALTWKSEILSEAYMKAPSGQRPGSADMQPQEGSNPHIHRQAPTIGSDADALVATRPPLGRVRVDKICALSYQGHRPTPSEQRETRQQTRSKAGMKALPPRSSNQYLARDQMWGINKVTHEDHLKALVPVELKRHGCIQESLLEEIARSGNELGAFRPTSVVVSANHARLKMTIAILQQAIRYGHHYGARFVLASTYDGSFILDLRSIEEAPEEPDGTPRLRWAFVDRGHIRLAFAYLFWRACAIVQTKLDDERVALEEAKRR